MKKWLIFSFLALITLSSLLVCAQDAQTSATPADTQSTSQTPPDQTKINISNASNVISSVEKVLEKDIVIPAGLKTIGKVLLGIKPDEKVELQQFVVIIGVWFMFFIVIINILNFMPSMNEGVSKWVGALIITCLAGVSGGLRLVALFFFDLGSLFGLWEKIWAPLRVFIVVFTLIQMILLLWATRWIMRLLKFKLESTKAEQVGEQAGLGIKLARILGQEAEVLGGKK